MSLRPRMSRIFGLISLTTTLLLAGQVSAQSALTLADCLDRAFRHSHLLRSRDVSVEIAREKWLEARSQIYPSLQVTGLYTRIGKITEFSIPMGPTGQRRTFRFGTPNRMNLDVKLQWPVFTWGRIESSLELSRLGQQLASLERQQEALNLTEQVLRGYFSCLLNQEIVRIQEENLSRAEQHLQVARRRFEAGVAPRLDVLRAEVQWKTAQANLEEAQTNLHKSRIFLGKLLGMEPEEIKLAGELRFEPVVVNEEELVSKALTRRVELRQIALRRGMAETQVSLANSGNKPSVYLFSGYSVQNGFDPMDPERFVDNYNAGVQVVFPLFDGNASRHKAQQARLELQSLELQEKEFEELIRMQIRQALATLRQAEKNVALQEENILLSQEALKSAETQYENGLIAAIQLVDARQALTQSELLHTQAIFNHIMAKLEICRAIGDFSWFESSLESR